MSDRQPVDPSENLMKEAKKAVTDSLFEQLKLSGSVDDLVEFMRVELGMPNEAIDAIRNIPPEEVGGAILALQAQMVMAIKQFSQQIEGLGMTMLHTAQEVGRHTQQIDSLKAKLKGRGGLVGVDGSPILRP